MNREIIRKFLLGLHKNNIMAKKIRVGNIVSIKTRTTTNLNKNKFLNFQGLVILKKDNGIFSSCVLRRISSNLVIEKLFKLNNPNIIEIIIKRNNTIRKSRLYSNKY